DQRNRCGTSPTGRMTRAANRWASSLHEGAITPGWGWMLSALGGCDHGHEGVGQHGQGCPSVPGPPAADLMLIQAAQPLAGLEGLLDPPSAGSPAYPPDTAARCT